MSHRQPFSVIVVEDETPFVEALTPILEVDLPRILKISAVTVTVIPSLDEARRSIPGRLHETGLITMDGTVIGGQTNNLTRWIRHNLHFIGPMLAISGGSPEYLSELRKAGCNDVMRKPFEYDELLAKLLRLLTGEESHPRTAIV